eukprot:gene8929-1601_t
MSALARPEEDPSTGPSKARQHDPQAPHVGSGSPFPSPTRASSPSHHHQSHHSGSPPRPVPPECGQPATLHLEPGSTRMRAAFACWDHGAQGAYSMTFDDGHPSTSRYAAETLQQAGLRATFYVINNVLKRFDRANKSDLGGWDFWGRMASAGHEVGSHTRTHGNHVLKDAEMGRIMKNEWAASVTELKQRLGRDVYSVSYPHGRKGYNSAVYDATVGTLGVLTGRLFGNARELRCPKGDLSGQNTPDKEDLFSLCSSDMHGPREAATAAELARVFPGNKTWYCSPKLGVFSPTIARAYVRRLAIDARSWLVSTGHYVMDMGTQRRDIHDMTKEMELWCPWDTETFKDHVADLHGLQSDGLLWVATVGQVARYLLQRKTLKLALEPAHQPGVTAQLVLSSIPGGWQPNPYIRTDSVGRGTEPITRAPVFVKWDPVPMSIVLQHPGFSASVSPQGDVQVTPLNSSASLVRFLPTPEAVAKEGRPMVLCSLAPSTGDGDMDVAIQAVGASLSYSGDMNSLNVI